MFYAWPHTCTKVYNGSGNDKAVIYCCLLPWQALHYADLTGKILIKHPHHFNSTLIKNMKEVRVAILL